MQLGSSSLSEPKPTPWGAGPFLLYFSSSVVFFTAPFSGLVYEVGKSQSLGDVVKVGHVFLNRFFPLVDILLTP